MIDATICAPRPSVSSICAARAACTSRPPKSCTGGLVAAALTEIAGSSDVVECGFVTYSNAAKEAMLGVPPATLKRHGAVSAETAAAMAAGALGRSQADLAVAITGIAGPGGGSRQKPVGLVHFAAASRDGRRARPQPPLRQDRPAPRARALGRRSARAVAGAGRGSVRLKVPDQPKTIISLRLTPVCCRRRRRRGVRRRRRSGGRRRRRRCP